jgi:hypothetical protein
MCPKIYIGYKLCMTVKHCSAKLTEVILPSYTATHKYKNNTYVYFIWAGLWHQKINQNDKKIKYST